MLTTTKTTTKNEAYRQAFIDSYSAWVWVINEKTSSFQEREAMFDLYCQARDRFLRSGRYYSPLQEQLE